MAEIIDPYVHELLRDLRELTNRQFIYEDPWHGFVPYDGAPTEYQLGPPLRGRECLRVTANRWPA